MDAWFRVAAMLSAAVGLTLLVVYLWRSRSPRAQLMNALLLRASPGVGRWLVSMVLVVWAAVPLGGLAAIDPSRTAPQGEPVDTILGMLAMAAMLLAVTTALLARPRWAILPSQRIDWVPVTEWLRRVLRRPAGPAKARKDEADRAMDATVAALADVAAQPWFRDAVPIIEAATKRAARAGRPPPYLTDLPDPFLDLTLDDLERHGFATHEQVTAALTRAGSSEVPPEWLAAYERGEGEDRAWSRRELLARIGLRAERRTAS